MRIIYNGIDISDSVEVKKCVHNMYADCHGDTLDIVFHNKDGNWDKWQRTKNDYIVVENGSISTGKMFVHEISPQKGSFGLKTMSLPPNYDIKNSRSWESVKMSQIFKEVADKYGLQFIDYCNDDYLYKYISQDNMSDFLFLKNRCMLEGCSMVVYDNSIILYSESQIESNKAVYSLEIPIDAEYKFSDYSSLYYNAFSVESGFYRGSYELYKNNTNRATKNQMPIQASSDGECIRYAKNLLRYQNKYCFKGEIKITLTTEISAGSMVGLKTDMEPSWNCPVFIYQLRNDYIKGYSKLFFRKPLVGY